MENFSTSKHRWQAVLTDAALALALLLANPLVHHFGDSLRRYPPDTLAYISLAQSISSGGPLYVIRGHLDQAAVLPPVYPALVAFGSFFSTGWLDAAEAISKIACVVTTVLLLIFLRRHTNRAFAFGALLVLQLTGTWFEIGMMPLTEATFLLILQVALMILVKQLEPRPRLSGSYLLGVLAGVLTLTRSIGVIFIGLSLAAVVARSFASLSRGSRFRLAHAPFVLIGFASILLPYSALLRWQGATGPFSQTFRLGRYTVTATAADRAILARLRPTPSDSYGEAYAKRRQLRRLNPEATEMYAFLVEEEAERDRVTRLLAVAKPLEWLRNFLDNLGHLKDQLGTFTFFLLTGSVFLHLTGLLTGRFSWRESIALLWILAYLAGLSLITSKVGRYTTILTPFAFVQLAFSLHCISRWAFRRQKRLARAAGGLVLPGLLGLACHLFAATSYSDHHLQKSLTEADLSISELRHQVPEGAPVLALFPMDPFVLGGTWHALPNDSLDRIANYGNRVGVRWMIVKKDSAAARELQFYNLTASWYGRAARGALDDTGLVRLRQSTRDGSADLYEIVRHD